MTIAISKNHWDYPFIPGSIGHGLNSPDGVYNEDIAYKVVGESTRQAYEQTCLEHACWPEWDNPDYVYHEIQTD